VPILNIAAQWGFLHHPPESHTHKQEGLGLTNSPNFSVSRRREDEELWPSCAARILYTMFADALPVFLPNISAAVFLLLYPSSGRICRFDPGTDPATQVPYLKE